MSIGYLRTCCWSKVQYLFEGMPITKLHLKRTRYERGKKGVIDSPHPWLRLFLYGTATIEMDWDFFKHKVPYSIAIRDFTELQRKNDLFFEDFVIGRIEIAIEDETLTAMINKAVKERNILEFSSGTRFYVMYKNAPVAYSVMDGVNIKKIRDINSIAIKELGFKLGVLDLKEIHTYTKEREEFNFVLEDEDIIRRVIREHINHGRWFELSEVNQLKEKTYPGALRAYERRSTDKWALVREEEIR